MPTTSITRTLQEKRIVFVSGKGGVGKSLVAAGLALDLTKQGKRVLLAEVGENSYYKDFWNLPAVGHDPVRAPLGFDLALWSGETSLREYVLFYLKMERLYHLFFENKVMRSLVNVAPGLNEIAILGKITSGIRNVGPPLKYDVIVVDAFATGHALALLDAPKGMMEAIKFGPMGHHSREIDQVLRNENEMAYVIVTLLEELPVTEALEFHEALKRKFGVHAHVFANKVLRSSVSLSDLQSVANDGTNPGLAEFAKHIVGAEDRQKKYGEVIRDFSKWETASFVEIPLIFSADPVTLVEKTAEALRAQ